MNINKNKKLWIVFAAGLVAGIGLVALAMVLQPSSPAKTESYALDTEVTVKGIVTGKEDELKGNIDGPKKLTVKLDNGETVTTNYYCGYTKRQDAVVADKDIKVGDRVEIFGVYEINSFIRVCNEKYSIRKV